MSQEGSLIGDTGLNNATNQTKVFDGKFDSNIQPKTVNLTLSTYEDPLYGQTTRLKVDNEVKTGNTMIKSIKDDTLGPKLHATNLPAVSNIIKEKLSEIDIKNSTKFIDGFNNPAHANNCVKATGYGQSSDIENIICQLRQKYDTVNDDKKEELFYFIKYLNTEKTNANWRFTTYTDPKTKGLHKVEEYYKQILGTFVPTVSTEEQKSEINKLLVEIKQPLLNRQNDAWANDQLSGIDLAAKEITLDTNIRSSYAAYIYNLNQLKSLLKDKLYYNYTVVSKSKPMSQDNIYKFIVNTNNVASRNASAAVSATGTGLSTLGTGLSTMGKSALNMAKSATATQPATQAVENTTTQPVNTLPAPAPAKSSWWLFGKGGKSKKNKKSNSKKQKKSSRKQQKRRKSAKK